MFSICGIGGQALRDKSFVSDWALAPPALMALAILLLWRLSAGLIPTAAEQGPPERLRRHSLGRSAAPLSAGDAKRRHRGDATPGLKLLRNFGRSSRQPDHRA